MNIITQGGQLRFLPLLFVALTGSLGTIYLLGTNMSMPGLSTSSEMSWNDSNLLEDKHVYLSTFGLQEVGRTLEFVIQDYNEKTTYEMDFGDGKCQEIRQSNVSHSYDKPGLYTVRLSVVYLDELIVLNESKLRISVPAP